MVVSVNAPRAEEEEAEIAPEGEATEEASDAKDDEGSVDNPEESS